MAQPVFPTFSRYPVSSGFNKTYAFDNRLVTEFDDGPYLSQARHTDVPRSWTVVWTFMTAANVAALNTFYEGSANWGAEPIKWTDRSDDVAYFVYFNGPPEYKPENEDASLWQISVTFIEALGSYT